MSGLRRRGESWLVSDRVANAVDYLKSCRIAPGLLDGSTAEFRGVVAESLVVFGPD